MSKEKGSPPQGSTHLSWSDRRSHRELRRPRRFLFGALSAPVVILVALGMLLAACGGSSSAASTPAKSASGATSVKAGSSPSGSGAGGSTAASATSFTAYTSCMKSHGVDLGGFGDFHGFKPGSKPPASKSGTFPAGGFGPGGTHHSFLPKGVSEATFKKATAACSSLRPKGAFGGFGDSATSLALKTYTNCLKLHGVTLPAFSPTSSSHAKTAEPALASAKDKAALAACAALRPKFSRPSTPATSTSS